MPVAGSRSLAGGTRSPHAELTPKRAAVCTTRRDLPIARHPCRRIGRGEPAAPSPPTRRPGIEVASRPRVEGTAMVRNTTLLDLVNAVAEYSHSEAELIATVVYMVNRGHVRLCGTFKGSGSISTRWRQPEPREGELPCPYFRERGAGRRVRSYSRAES